MKIKMTAILSRFKKYSLLFSFINLTIWTSLASTPLNEVFHFSQTASRLFSLMLYAPFFLLMLWKFIGDIRHFEKAPVNISYYIFTTYYAILTVFRFINGLQVKENIYYSLVLLGSVALFCQIRYNRLNISNEDYHRNFIGIVIYMCAYKFIASVFATGMFGMPRILSNPPVNNLYSTSILVVLLPFMIDNLRKNGKTLDLKNVLLLSFSLILIVICNSRAIFILAFLILAALTIINIRNHCMVLKIFSAFVCMVLIVGAMAATNVTSIRYSLSRVMAFFPNSTTQDDKDSSSPQQDNSESVTETPDTPSENNDIVVPNPPSSDTPEIITVPEDDTSVNVTPPSSEKPLNTEPNTVQENAINQINKSDTMRSDLLKLGIEEIKKNPLFGTGELFYSYDMGYKIMEQSAHNFIIETIVCFGIIGLLFIAALFFFMLVDCGFFKKSIEGPWQVRVSAFAAIAYYFIFGMVQPSVYNALLCPMFALIIAFYGSIFGNRKKR